MSATPTKFCDGCGSTAGLNPYDPSQLCSSCHLATDEWAKAADMPLLRTSRLPLSPIGPPPRDPMAAFQVDARLMLGDVTPFPRQSSDAPSLPLSSIKRKLPVDPDALTEPYSDSDSEADLLTEEEVVERLRSSLALLFSHRHLPSEMPADSSAVLSFILALYDNLSAPLPDSALLLVEDPVRLQRFVAAAATELSYRLHFDASVESPPRMQDNASSDRLHALFLSAPPSLSDFEHLGMGTFNPSPPSPSHDVIDLSGSDDPIGPPSIGPPPILRRSKSRA